MANSESIGADVAAWLTGLIPTTLPGMLQVLFFLVVVVAGLLQFSAGRWVLAATTAAGVAAWAGANPQSAADGLEWLAQNLRAEPLDPGTWLSERVPTSLFGLLVLGFFALLLFVGLLQHRVLRWALAGTILLAASFWAGANPEVAARRLDWIARQFKLVSVVPILVAIGACIAVRLILLYADRAARNTPTRHDEVPVLQRTPDGQIKRGAHTHFTSGGGEKIAYATLEEAHRALLEHRDSMDMGAYKCREVSCGKFHLGHKVSSDARRAM